MVLVMIQSLYQMGYNKTFSEMKPQKKCLLIIDTMHLAK